MIKTSIYLLVLVNLFVLPLKSQNLKEFYIECDPDDITYIYENYQEDIYIPVLLTYDGNTWTDVMMRIRGDSSREYPKKSLKVEFNTEPFVNGQSVLNFNAEYNDLSYMHSYLASITFEKAGLDCVSMEHVRIYLNGNYFGLYVLAENMDENFIYSRGYNPFGNLFKATRDGACMSINDNVFYHWELKSGDDPYMDNLTSLIQSLNNVSNEGYYEYIQETFSYENALGFIALNMLLSNGSTYYHNYFLYHDINETNRWYIFPWDLDKTVSDYGINYPYHRSSGFWTSDNPLLEKAIISEEMLNDISDKIEDYSNTFFNGDVLFPLIDSLENVLSTSVLEDTTDNIPNLTTWLQNIDADKNFITERYSYLLSQINNYPRNFHLNSLKGYYKPGETIQFNWSHSVDPVYKNITYSLSYGKDIALLDSTTTIISGLTDNSYSTDAIIQEGKYYWKVEADNGSGSITGYDSYNELYISTGIPEIIINEINYNSANNFNPEDWIEFYNAEDTAVNLSDWYFKDENNGHVFNFKSGTWIGANDYLVLCKDTSVFNNLFPASIQITGNMNYGLSSVGELVRLYHSSGYLVDSLVYRSENPWPTLPNGNGPTLELLNPSLNNALSNNWRSSTGHGTPGEQNSTYSPDGIYNQLSANLLSVEVYPNPFIDCPEVEYTLKKQGSVCIQLFDVFGKLILLKEFKNQSPGKHTNRLHTDKIAPGIYFCRIDSENSPAVLKTIIKQKGR